MLTDRSSLDSPLRRPPLKLITCPRRSLSASERVERVSQPNALRCRTTSGIGLRDGPFDYSLFAMPYVSPVTSPRGSHIAPLASPTESRTSFSSHWGQAPPTFEANGCGEQRGSSTPPRRHSRTHSHDFCTTLSPPLVAQIFLQPASPSPRDEAGPPPCTSAAVALNAPLDAPPPAISPRSSPSAQRLQLRSPPEPSPSGLHEVSTSPATCWPEGDPTNDGSPVASTSALPFPGDAVRMVREIVISTI
jgi:hypothetical protein